jgi:hypothetical protein
MFARPLSLTSFTHAALLGLVWVLCLSTLPGCGDEDDAGPATSETAGDSTGDSAGETGTTGGETSVDTTATAGTADGSTPADTAPDTDSTDTDSTDTGPGPDTDTDTDTTDGPEQPATFTVVTFNTGSGIEQPHDNPPDDGYSKAQAAITDEYYGNGLAWLDAVAQTRAWFDATRPAVVTFQEIFDVADCPNIPVAPVDARKGYVCETWQPGDPSVARRVLGPDYQIACNWGKPDKCAAVHRSFGVFRGCAGDECREGLYGSTVDTCGKGARVGRGVIDRVDGTTLTVVNVHGSSGFATSDRECRIKQFDQIFVDVGDGAPAANGAVNLIMGDFNTDPVRFAKTDISAAHLEKYIGDGLKFRWLTAVGETAPPTYGGLFNIDHIVSDKLTGECFTPGVTAGVPPVIPFVYFDHKPEVCVVR